MAMASRAVLGDLTAFEQTVRANTRPLYSLALAILNDQQEAEDAVQDTMVIAWGRWHSVRDEERRPAWLKRVCIRRCLRVKRRLFAVERLSEGQRDLRTSLTSDPDLDRAFRQLSPHQRSVVRLHYQDGYSLDECATFMGCRPGTARSHLARALTSLRKELANAE
jgi:RNA polymerase sigma-70 factor, ECF subfamily